MGKPTLIDLPEVRMRNPNDCGPAVARSVLRHFERPVMRVDSILRPTARDGTPPERLFALFVRSRLGAAARPRLGLDGLGQFLAAGCPVLCPVTWDRYGHWVAVRGLRGGRVYLMDPESGYADVPADDFLGHWRDRTGDGVELEQFGLAVFPA